MDGDTVLGGKSDGKVHHLPHWNTHEWLIRWFLWDHCRQKYTIFPDGSYQKYHFLTTVINDAQAGAGPVSWACFFFGGVVLVIHWNEPTHLWGVAWLTCLWSPLVCITRCFLFKEKSMRPHFCLRVFKHETYIDTGVPMIQLWLTAWLTQLGGTQKIILHLPENITNVPLNFGTISRRKTCLL